MEFRHLISSYYLWLLDVLHLGSFVVVAYVTNLDSFLRFFVTPTAQVLLLYRRIVYMSISSSFLILSFLIHWRGSYVGHWRYVFCFRCLLYLLIWIRLWLYDAMVHLWFLYLLYSCSWRCITIRLSSCRLSFNDGIKFVPFINVICYQVEIVCIYDFLRYGGCYSFSIWMFLCVIWVQFCRQ